MIEVTADIPALEDVAKKLGGLSKKAPDAMRMGINNSLRPLNKYIASLVSDSYTYKPKGLDDAQVVKARASALHGAIRFTGEPVPLDRFKHKPGAHGQRGYDFGYMHEAPGKTLTVEIHKGKPRPLPDAFVLNLHGKKIFRRAQNGKQSESIKKRLLANNIMPTGYNAASIERMFTTNVPAMVGNRDIAPQLQAESQNTLNKQIDRAIYALLQKGRAGA